MFRIIDLNMGSILTMDRVSTVSEPRSSGRRGPENYGLPPERRSSRRRVNYGLTLERRSSGWRVRGLDNYGLTCCVNALLQSFIATSELKVLLDRWDSSRVRDALDNVPVQLKGVLGAIRDPSCPAPHQDFLHCLDRQRIRLNVQHDADEVFLAVLNFIQQHMDDKALALEIQSLYRLSVELHQQCLNCFSTRPTPGHSYLLSLPLHIRHPHSNNTLKDCLASFFELQKLSGIDECFCAQCQTSTPSKQGQRILSLPTILCVQLQRFRYSNHGIHKLDCSVEFHESLDFQDICSQDVFSKDFQKNESTKYSLFAVIVHSGSAMFGHYTAFVRLAAGPSWFYADDSHVGPVSWEAVRKTYGGRSSRTAYMLLYRRDPTQTQGGVDGEKQEGEKQEGERREGERQEGERREGEKQEGEKQEGDKLGEELEGEKQEGERREGEKQEGEKQDGERREEEEQEGEKQDGERREEEEQGDKQEGDKLGEELEGQKQDGEKLEGEKQDGEKLDGEKLDGEPQVSG